MNPNELKSSRNISALILIGILTIITILAFNIFVLRGVPLLNHWLDYITIFSLVIIIIILGLKYLIEEVL